MQGPFATEAEALEYAREGAARKRRPTGCYAWAENDWARLGPGWRVGIREELQRLVGVKEIRCIETTDLKETMSMATRKRPAPKGKGGQSGGANPRNDGRITEQQHDDAMRVLRAEYYQGVRSLVEDLARAIKDKEVTDEDGLNEWIHQTVDGSYWVIYTHANFQVLMCSDHHDAYSENFGEPPVSGSDINWAALAFAAMEQDVRDQMSAQDVWIEPDDEDPNNMDERRRRPRRTPPSGPSLTRRRTASRRR